MHKSLPLTHNYSYTKRELSRFLSLQYPYVEFRFVFKNPLTIGSLFHFKDSLPDLISSFIIYLFTCPDCNSGKYIGASNRILKVRIDCHKGVSYRTGLDLNKKEFSAIRNHAASCKYHIRYQEFKILSQSQNSSHLPFLESLFIKQLSPNLNNSISSVHLHIA